MRIIMLMVEKVGLVSACQACAPPAPGSSRYKAEWNPLVPALCGVGCSNRSQIYKQVRIIKQSRTKVKVWTSREEGAVPWAEVWQWITKCFSKPQPSHCVLEGLWVWFVWGPQVNDKEDITSQGINNVSNKDHNAINRRGQDKLTKACLAWILLSNLKKMILT